MKREEIYRLAWKKLEILITHNAGWGKSELERLMSRALASAVEELGEDDGDS